MNSVKCPQCGLVNWGTPPACKRCGRSFEGVSAQDLVSIPAGEQQTYAAGFPVDPAMNFAQETEQTRKVWKWFVIYCVLMTLLYLVTAGAGAFLLLFDFSSARNRDVEQLQGQGIIFLLIGLILMIPYAMGPFLKGKSWGWTYGIVLIAIGMTSCCLWPITIPLLIQWIKPEMKRAFGQS